MSSDLTSYYKEQMLAFHSMYVESSKTILKHEERIIELQTKIGALKDHLKEHAEYLISSAADLVDENFKKQYSRKYWPQEAKERIEAGEDILKILEQHTK